VFGVIAAVIVLAVAVSSFKAVAKCSNCDGTGRVWGGLRECPDCKGRGVLGK
jgi:DnaJ-class molecular chaperone